MSYSIQCTHCQAVLKSSALVLAGKKVKCPKCGQMFTTGEPKREMPPKPAAPTPPPAESLAEDDEMDAAIAKLEAEQAGGKKPAAKPTPVVQPVAMKPQAAAEPEDFEVPEIDDDLVVPDE